MAEQLQGASPWSRGIGGPERKQKNVVQLKSEVSGQCPTRGAVVDLVLLMGFRVSDLFAVIQPSNSLKFDVSFMTPVGMELFLTNFEVLKRLDPWKSCRVFALYRQEEFKNVTVLVRNESLLPEG